MLQRLHDLKIQINVDLVADLKARRARPARTLFAKTGQVITIDCLAFGVVYYLEVSHALEANSV